MLRNSFINAFGGSKELAKDAEVVPKRSRTTLLIIDPQVDFHPGGSLAVAGADQDSERIANLILQFINEIDEIYVTLDTHQVSSLFNCF